MIATYWQLIPNDIRCGTNVTFRLLCTKGVYPNSIIEGNKVFNI